MSLEWNAIVGLFASPAFNTELFGNSISRYLLALGFFFALWFAARLLFRRALFQFGTEGAPTKLDEALLLVLRNIRPSVYTFAALYIALKLLEQSPAIERAFNVALLAFLAYQLAAIAGIVISYLVRKRLRGKDNEGQTDNAAHLLMLMAQIVIWSFGALLVLSNFGINVSSLIAGLGIGGIAVAFALQNILGDLFSSFALHFDKPFVVGDFIIIGDKMGVVQKIGIKTTRIRALQGEELVISNQELTTAKIQNFKRMRERRVLFTLGVMYETPLLKARAIPDIVKNILADEKLARFDRAHFQKFGASSLDFECVYYLLSSDYNAYMDTQQNINFKIMEAFEKEGIVFAYPTQTLYVRREADKNTPTIPASA